MGSSPSHIDYDEDFYFKKTKGGKFQVSDYYDEDEFTEWLEVSEIKPKIKRKLIRLLEGEHVLPFSFVHSIELYMRRETDPTRSLDPSVVKGFVATIMHRLEGKNESDGGQIKLCIVKFSKEELESRSMKRFADLIPKKYISTENGDRFYFFWADKERVLVGKRIKD